ncbi:MAG: hypothetical protein HY000_21210 [Planctomycetes bacterium]|nr:hypothetical protein [Planctomycetota bacterium]
MKRVFLEWGTIAASAFAVMLLAVWVASYFIDPWQYQLTTASEFHVIAHDGYISFFNNTDIDPQTGKRIILKIYNPKNPMEILDPVTTHIAWSIPGFQWFYCRLGNGNAFWSLELSPLLPTVLLAATAFILWRRNRPATGSTVTKKTQAPDYPTYRIAHIGQK